MHQDGLSFWFYKCFFVWTVSRCWTVYCIVAFVCDSPLNELWISVCFRPRVSWSLRTSVIVILLRFSLGFRHHVQWLIQQFWQGGAGAEGYVSASSSFIANAHEELYAFFYGKIRVIQRILRSVGGGRYYCSPVPFHFLSPKSPHVFPCLLSHHSFFSTNPDAESG